jgi:hypothetical protein
MITQYDTKPDKARCDSCGKYISKQQQRMFFKGDGLDAFRIVQCTKCKTEESKRGF